VHLLAWSLVKGEACAGEFATLFEGQVEFTQYQLTGQPIVDHFVFRAEVDDCKWRIRTAEAREGLTNNLGGYFSSGFDGTNLYSFSSLGKGPVGTKSTADNPIVKSGRIFTKDFAPYDQSRSSLVWIALASGCYLQEQSYARCKPIWATAPGVCSVERGFLTSEIKRIEGSFLPEEIIFHIKDDAFVDFAEAPPGEKLQYPPPFDKGFVKARYRVEAVDHSGVPVYPKTYTLEVFNPRDGASNTNDLQLAWQVRGEISNMQRLTARIDFRPEIMGSVRIQDYRDQTNGGVIEYVSNGWEPTNSVHRTKSLDVGKTQGQQESMRKTARITGLAIFVASGIGLIITVRRYSKTLPEDGNK